MGSQTVDPTSTANNIIKNGWNFHQDCLFWLSYFSLDYWLDTTFLLIDTRHNSLFGDSQSLRYQLLKLISSVSGLPRKGWGGGRDLYIILDRKGTPFTYLVQNFASLFTAVNALLQIWTNHKTRVFSQLFHSQKMHLLAPYGLFTDWNDRFPFPFIYFN